MQEIWKDVKGFEGYYQISTYGRLKSFKVHKNGAILKTTNKNGDYLAVVLQASGKVRHTRIHRLVAEAFLPNPNNFPEVNHIDENKQNNCIDNLEWCTRQHNIDCYWKSRSDRKAKRDYSKTNRKIKPIVQLDLEGNVLNVFESAASASRVTGVCARNILQMANKTPYKKDHLRKSAGGYKWEFENE